MPTATVVSQGDEIVTGQITDTNAAFLAARLVGAGFEVREVRAVGDRLDDLVALYRELGGVGEAGDGRAPSDLVVSTGGLGPTSDDLTAEAVARAAGVPLVLHAPSLDRIQAYYAATGREMPVSNAKQAELPAGAEVLPNARGTAPGFLARVGAAAVLCMPGVPREMKAMFDDALPALAARFGLAPGRLVTLRTAGRGESDLQDALSGLALPAGVVLGFRTTPTENHIKLRAEASVPAEALAAAVAAVRDRVGRAVFAVEGAGPLSLPPPGPGARPASPWLVPDGAPGSLPAAVGAALVQAGARLGVAESCTGGQLAAACTALAGSSAWFQGGVVAYDNRVKQGLLGVSEADLREHGAVSEPVAAAMATGARGALGVEWALSTTGIAGPGGATADKPVGLVYVGLAGPGVSGVRALRLRGDRATIQARTVGAALDLLRRHLQGVADGGPPG